MRRLDGGLATTLQRVGLPPYSPVEPWVVDRPEEVLAAQEAFENAGAQVLCTPTFRALPSVSSAWREQVSAGAALTRRAARDAEVWLSLGPGEGHADSVEAAGRVDGVVLETNTDLQAALDALASVVGLSDAVVVSFVPGIGSFDVEDAAKRVMSGGAIGFGLNCAPGPQILRAVRAVPSEVPLWLKPSGGPGQLECWEACVTRARWMGGCCGTTPEAIEALARLS